MRFIADSNVGRLGRWLRIAGYNTLFIKDIDDNRLIRIALDEDRVLLTKDTQILKRRLVTSRRLKTILIEDDEVKAQLRQVLTTLNLSGQLRPFSLCVECNESLVPGKREEVEELVPPYVFQTQTHYMQCPTCQRIYWRGTHWEKMSKELAEIAGSV